MQNSLASCVSLFDQNAQPSRSVIVNGDAQTLQSSSFFDNLQKGSLCESGQMQTIIAQQRAKIS